MDTIPLINPKLVKVVTVQAERTPAPVLRAEVVSSTPVKEPSSTKTESTDSKTASSAESVVKQQKYKIILKIGQQQLEVVSTTDLKKSSQIEVKILPGPELKIINNDQKAANLNEAQPQSLATSKTNGLMQQLLADRIPRIQQQELSSLVKQLTQLINAPLHNLKPEALQSESLKTNTFKSELSTTNTHGQVKNAAPNKGTGKASSSDPIKSASPLQQVKTWLQQLPKSQDIGTSIGLRNALNNTGIQAENQLSQLAQQFLILNNKNSANSIFQQLQQLQRKLTPLSESPNQEILKQKVPRATRDKPEAKINLADIVKRTAKTLSDNSRQVLSGLVKTKATTSINTSTARSATSPASAIGISAALQPAPSPWQNPLLTGSQYSSMEDLLRDPLLQSPSSNNKFALSQLLSIQREATDFQGRTPLNWPERMGNDAPLMRNLQNLLGHIEREQAQQMQSAETNPNNPSQLTTQNQQWLPLLINNQQQLQLIEFYIDKEERQSSEGEKKHHWFINLHFDLPHLGKLGIEISMFENECSTTFWSESRPALNQLSQHIQPLRERLSEQGIIINNLQSRHGTLIKRKHSIQQRLVDIKT